MEFYGTIDSVKLSDGGCEVRLISGVYLSPEIKNPVLLIKADSCTDLPDDIDSLKGEEIDGYEITDGFIELYTIWRQHPDPVRISATGVSIEPQNYSVQDYVNALASSHEYSQSLTKDIVGLRKLIEEYSQFVDHELDNLNRRIEYHPEKSDKYLKAIEILQRFQNKMKKKA
ncbi:MAG: hypothetical protein AAFY98_06030 [Verrucomicrobiota bacterium]